MSCYKYEQVYLLHELHVKHCKVVSFDNDAEQKQTLLQQLRSHWDVI